MQQDQNSALPQSLKNKFFSIRSRSQSKLGKLQSLRSLRNSNYVSNEKQWSTQKLKHKTPVLGQILKPQSYNKTSPQKELFSLQMVKQSTKLRQLLKKLHTSFIHNKIPQFYTYYFYKRLKDLRQQSFLDTINRQINWLKQKKSHYQMIEPMIKAREGCLRQLQKSLDSLFKDQQNQESFTKFKQEIRNYRKITTLVINQMKLWKDYLNNLCERQCQQNPVFLYKNEDYFVTLMNDNMFIFNSFLSTYLKFTDKNDPFILKPIVDRSKNQKYCQLFTCTQEQRNQYIVLINYLAEQRAKQLYRKVSTNDDRVRDIERIYRSTKHNTDDLKAQLLMINQQMKRSKTHDLQIENRLKQQIKKVNDNKNDSRIDENDEKQYMSETERKSQAMKRIREMVSSKNSFSYIINKNKIIDGSQLTTRKSDNQHDTFTSPIRMKLSKIDYDDDFLKIMRKKQLQVLEQAKEMKSIQWKLRKGLSMREADNLLKMAGNNSSNLGRSGSFKMIRISDSLSKERRLFNNQACMNQLQAIVSGNDISNNSLGLSRSRALSTKIIQSENKSQANNEQIGKNNLKNLSQQKKLAQNQKKTLIEKNEDVMLQMRATVLKQIQEQQSHQQQYLAIKKQQNQKMQKILHSKIQAQVLRQTKNVKNYLKQGKNVNNQLDQTQLQKEIQQKLDKQRQNLKIDLQLRKQFQQKLLRQVYNDLKNSPQYKQLDSEQKRIKQKQQQQKRYKQIQQQQRAKLMKIMVELDLKKKKEIEIQMERVIKEEKQKMEKLSYETKVKLQHELKQQAKSRLLTQLKSENQQYERGKLTQIELKLKEQKYRQQLRRKLTKQYKLQEVVERQKQKEQKDKKLKMIQQKFQEYDGILINKSKKNKQSSIFGNDDNDILKGQNALVKTHLKTLTVQEARERILQQDSPQKKSQHDEKYRRLQQSQKAKLREQFEVELFAFMKPQKYSKKQTDSQIIIKDIQSIAENVEGLSRKQQTLKQQIEQIKLEQNSFKNQYKQIDNNIAKQQKIERIFNKQQQTQTQRFERFSSVANNLQDGPKQQKKLQKDNVFLKKSQISLTLEEQKSRIKLSMTVEQYQIYIKKKALINKNIKIIDQKVNKNNQTMKKQQQHKVSDQFQLLDLGQYQQDRLNMQMLQNPDFKSQLSQKLRFDPIDQDLRQKVNNNITQKKNRNSILPRSNTKKQQYLEQKNKQIVRLSARNRNNSRLTNNKNDKFMTSGSDDEEQSIRIDIQSPYDQMQRNKNKGTTKKLDKQRQQQSIKKNKPKIIQKEQQSIQKPPTPQPHNSQPAFIKQQHIKSSLLEQFMKDHFEHMPKLIKRLNLYKRDQLVKILRQDYNSFTILELIEDNMSLGIVIAVENRNKKNMRAFNIIHVGPYDESDTLKLLVKSSQHIFTHDPLEEITMSIFYHTDDQQQSKFIKKFEKEFDPYGSIFQKKIYDTQYERKLVMRRILGMKQVKHKEKVNCGSFWVQNQLIVMERSLGVERYELQDAGVNCGSYGIVGMYLAQRLPQQKLIKILAKQNTQNDQKASKNLSNIKHLAKQSLSFKQDIQKLCSQKQYHQQSFPNALQFNLNRHKQSKTLVKCLPEYHQQPIECTQLSIGLQIQLTYPFTIQPAKFMFDDDEYIAEYLRFVVQKKSKQKTYTVRSSLYSSVLTFMPCKNSRYKMFVMSSEEYDGLVMNSDRDNKQQSINLDVYIKLFFANLSSHEISTYQTIWLPEFKSIQEYNCKQIEQSFMPESRSTLKSQMQFYYTSYLPNSLVFEPSHRDLFITAPFILGVIDSQMQLVAEGSALVVKRIQLGDLIGLKEVMKIVDED